jgi:anti-sigma B factor antagonist
LNDCTGHDIIIDCTNLEYISSSGLRILLNIRKNAAAVGSKVTILNINKEIQKVFEMT